MSTIGYQLNILRDTQMVQRRLLEKMFPYIDWGKMPFSSYGDFFRLRGILDDCGAVWTNAYGRSNTEADGQRNFLEDYSGNGRDIELFNFGYSGNSGYGGFRNYTLMDLHSAIADYLGYTYTNNILHITEIKDSEGFNRYLLVKPLGSISTDDTIKGKIKITGISALRETITDFYCVFAADNNPILKITEDGTYDWLYTKTDGAEWFSFSLSAPNQALSGISLTIEQIPDLNGAIVSDGVDDYGQCIKDFALPDDYTVVAMREILTPNSCLASKIQDAQNGAFCMELFGNSTISYGTVNNSVPPKLFSFQTRVSYNGSSINSGTSGDGNTNKLILFKRPLDTPCSSVALYSFGIFTRTLTADELRIVENCMYAEWIAMTGKLEDIEYYDILDARFRSNEEAEDKRNKWVGRLGKLHMTLKNYAYSQMSGWDGYPVSMENWIVDNSSEIIKSVSATKAVFSNIEGLTLSYINFYGRVNISQEVKVCARISGLESGEYANIMYRDSADTKWIEASRIVTDGLLSADIPSTTRLLFSVKQITNKVNREITIELIPDYGGALVSDGVDDYAVSDEVIDEEIGGFVCHAEFLAHKGYIFYAGAYANPESIFYCAGSIDNQFIIGNPNNTYNGFMNPVALSKIPAGPNVTLSIASVYNSAYAKCALYQLRLIKNQPTDIQLEAIKWQCRKEHDDYLIHMGWKEVE